MQNMGTTSTDSPELLVELRRHLDRPLRAQLEDGLRDAARSGRLAAGARLPATRALAADLGVSQALVLLARALDGPHLAVEDPGLPPHRMILAAHGARLSALPIDAQGAQVAALPQIASDAGAVDGVLVTPAHQCPLGVAMAPSRR